MPDFNHNGFNDIVLRNYKTGDNVIWSMGGANGTTVVGGLPLPNVPQPGYRLELTADFNNDTHPDILFRNYETGENLIWLMNQNNIIGGALLPPLADEAWQPRVAGDFTRDGKIDIVWRNTATGENLVWVIDETTVTGSLILPPVSSDWRLSTGGDVDRNGTGDLFWRNSLTGENVIWRMQGSTLLDVVALPRVPEGEWRIEGADDFDRNGFADFQWRNYRTGENLVWLMDGVNLIGGAVLPPLAANSGWESPSGSFDNLVLGSDDNDAFSGILGADFILAHSGQDWIAGNSGNDTLSGNTGEDSLFGEDGDDFLIGDSESDFLYGGIGNDTLKGGFSIPGSPQQDWDILTGGEGSDIFVLRTTAAALPIVINPSEHSTENADEADIITDFQDGIDRLVLPEDVRFSYSNYQASEFGINLLFSPYGIQGESTYIHVVNYDASSDSDFPIAVLQNVAPDRLSVEDFIGSDLTIVGTPENDLQTSLDGENHLFALVGDIGNDRISGLAGNDLLVGSLGQDTLTGDEGNDTLIGGSSFQATWGLDYQNNNLSGGLGDDLLISGDNTDRISFSRNSNPDILTGGEGRDTFALNKYTDFSFFNAVVNPDRVLQITDFQDGVDVLSVSDAFIGLEFQATGLHGEDTLIFTRQTGLRNGTWGIAVIESVPPHLIAADDLVAFPL